MSALSKIHAIYGAREQSARGDRGRGVVGYISNNVPIELILAAGLTPIQLTGSAKESTPVGDVYMEEIFDGYVRSLFNRILEGRFNFCDLIVIPRTSEGLLQLYYFLAEVRKWEPERHFSDVYLFDLLQTPYWATGRYVRGRVDALKQRLEELSGEPTDDRSIRDAVSTVNRTRDLQRQVNALRRDTPSRLSGSDALRIFGANGFTSPAEYQALLTEIIAAPPASLTTGVRVMIKGSPHDDTRFYELVERCGGIVVADDHTWGERMFDGRVRETNDQLDAIAFYYQTQSFSPRSYPQSDQDARFLANVEAAKVDAVIFFIEEHDDTFGWDYPDQKKVLDRLGIPSLYLPLQSYRKPDTAMQEAAVRTFLQGAAARWPAS
jgi:benzoyl-CoA reductase/2-hydroxyglutaryl-CoA dehydratase subunit BcrC/BadD/HgdB